MEIEVFQIDTFTNSIFQGNPAVVCPLNEWLSSSNMQNIAMENCVAETVFFIPAENSYEIRWFTPEIEMDLCGHATLAAAHVIWSHLGGTTQSICFISRSGELNVTKNENLITLDFPSRKPTKTTMPSSLVDVFHIEPIEVLKSRDYIFVYETQEQILSLNPDRNLFDLINLDPGGLVVTAKGDEVDFVSRFFTPQASILEDPVTGSAHCSLIPYWAKKLSKRDMTARQLSSREGALYCSNLENRVNISGEAVTYMKGVITI